MDNIISDSTGRGMNIPSKAVLIMDHLLNGGDKNKFDPFIYNTFKVFLNQKTKIKIDMFDLDDNNIDVSFLYLIFGGRGFKKSKYGDTESESDDDSYDVIGDSYSIPSDNTNLPKLNSFKNLETIEIEYVQYGETYYPFSLSVLSSKLDKTKMKEIRISTGYKATDGTSWLSFVWSRDSSSLKQEYKNKGYIITFKTSAFGDCISINKL